MTQEEKDLLLKDITARLHYGVKIKRSNCPINLSVNGILGEYVHHIPFYVGGNIEINTTKIDEVKPYLRPMSSMTEDERKEYNDIVKNTIDFYDCPKSEDVCLFVIPIDWLNKKKFDYRGLIKKGLALEAPEGMYN